MTKEINYARHRYFVDAFRPEIQNLNYHLVDISERLADLEEKVFQNKKEAELTRAQKNLLLDELGVYEYLFTKKFSQKTIAKIMALLIGYNFSNIERDLSTRFDRNSRMRTRENYETIREFLRDLKVSDLNDIIDKAISEFPEVD